MAHTSLSIVTQPSLRIDSKSILDALPDIVFVICPENTLSSVNTAAEVFFGASASQITGQKLKRFLFEDSPVFSLLTQCRNSGKSVSDNDFRLATPQRSRQRFSLFMSPIEANSHEIVIVLKVAQEAGERLRSREATRAAQIMSAMIAHEIKNPLAGIRGAAQLLEQTAVSAEDIELTALICDETDRIRQLVERMDVFAEDRLLNPQPVNIHSVLDHVKKSAQAGFARHVRFEESYDPSLPEAAGDYNQLVQLFLNLVKNAAEAANEQQSCITISTSYQSGIRLMADGVNRKLPLLVSIKDNGCGIAPKLQASLFDPFVSDKPGGTGLGLAIAARIVDDHGGLLDFQSRQGHTEFRVSLPLWGK